MSTATHPNFYLVPAHTSEVHLSTVRSLFTAYTKWLDLDLTFQKYAAKLAALPGAYAPPSGALLSTLDTDSSMPLGVIALRPFTYHNPTGDGSTSNRRCEMKRLYTVPEARGRGVARALRLDIEGYNPEGAGSLAR
jgi:GNAT superfamily N-acetyltransferase